MAWLLAYWQVARLVQCAVLSLFSTQHDYHWFSKYIEECMRGWHSGACEYARHIADLAMNPGDSEPVFILHYSLPNHGQGCFKYVARMYIM
jgi:hypothetical protein